MSEEENRPAEREKTRTQTVEEDEDVEEEEEEKEKEKEEKRFVYGLNTNNTSNGTVFRFGRAARVHREKSSS